jgi:NADH-quinone oxidoreductase subunit F
MSDNIEENNIIFDPYKANYKDFSLLSYHHIANIYKLKIFEKAGGYQILKKIFKMNPSEIRDVVLSSGLQERGRAFGTLAGVKWGFLNSDSAIKKYLICNATESESGSFKDRYLLEINPHLLLEGIIISSYALGVEKSYIYIRGEFYHQAKILELAIKECYERGFLGSNILGSGFNLDVFVHRGAGTYISGDETAIISSLEGKKAIPKLTPPIPEIRGYRDCPTLVSNVETICVVPWLMRFGADEYRKRGTSKSCGTKLFSISGDIQKPGVIEVPFGTPLKDVIYEYCGGMVDDHKLKACFVGGISSEILTADESLSVNLDYESLEKLGSNLGPGNIIVINESRSIGDILKWVIEFYHEESCGECTPCREGTAWMEMILSRSLHGKGKISDIDLISSIAKNIKGKNICSYSDEASKPINSIVKKYRNELEQFILEN